MAIGFLLSGELLQNIKGFILDFSTSLQKKHNKEINMLRKCQILIFCIYSLSYIYNCVQISILKNFYEFRTGFLNGCNTFRLKIFQLFCCWVQLMIWEDLTLTFLLVNSDVCAINLINLRTTTMKLRRSIQLSIKILPNPTNSDKVLSPGTP